MTVITVEGDFLCEDDWVPVLMRRIEEERARYQRCTERTWVDEFLWFIDEWRERRWRM